MRHRLLYPAVMSLITTVMAAACACAQQSLADELAAVRRGLAVTKSTFPSATGTISVTRTWTDSFYRLTDTPPSEPDQRTSKGVWAISGNALFARYEGQPPHSTVSSYTVGDRRVRIEDSTVTDRQDVFISTKRGPISSPLEYGYTLKGVWYSDIISARGFRVTGVRNDPAMGRVVSLEGPLGPDRTLIAAFAKDRGYIAVSAEKRSRRETERSSRQVWRVTRVQRVKSFWFPLEAAYEWYLIYRGAPVLLTRSLAVLSPPEVGGDYSHMLKPPPYRAGALVHDEDAGAYFTVAQDGTLEFAGRMGEAGPSFLMQVPPMGWLGIACLGATVTIIGGAGYRRRLAARR